MQELLALAEEDREIAMQRFRWLQPHLEENKSLRLVATEAGLHSGLLNVGWLCTALPVWRP
jgi:hypothetical protein